MKFSSIHTASTSGFRGHPSSCRINSSITSLKKPLGSESIATASKGKKTHRYPYSIKSCQICSYGGGHVLKCVNMNKCSQQKIHETPKKNIGVFSLMWGVFTTISRLFLGSVWCKILKHEKSCFCLYCQKCLSKLACTVCKAEHKGFSHF